MENENLIHVKLEYKEALQSKKDILSSEMDLLKISRTIKKYHSIRSEELKLKTKLHRKIKETITNIRKLQTILPKLEMLGILKKDEYAKEISKTGKKTKEDKYDKDLEYQLQEIQNKLKSLAG